MESWFCIYDDLANPKIGLNLFPNPLYYLGVGDTNTAESKILRNFILNQNEH
jgi:hypothetical protein